MAEAPTDDNEDAEKLLTPDDAINVYEELLPAQNHSYMLGLKLELPQHVVEAIHSPLMPLEPYLLQVIVEFTNQERPRPTRRFIAKVLRSPAIRMSALAKKIEESHLFKKPTLDVIPKCTAPDLSQIKSEEVSKRIKELEKRFNTLKETTMECLKKRQVLVEKVAGVLTSISPDEDDQHKMFLECHIKVLYEASKLPELFGTMNFHWNYLNPPLLDHLVKSFDLEEVKGEMESYKIELKQFRVQTPLAVFCRTQKRRRLRLAPEFREVVVEFNWPKDVTLTLEFVEQFRQEYVSQYNLRDCAMMVAHIRYGSYIITMIVPESIVAILKSKAVRAVLKKYRVMRLVIDEVCVYQLRMPEPSVTLVPSNSSGVANEASIELSDPRDKPSPPATYLEEEYPFVEQPSEDFFCPVTFGLLRQPYLTSCCGNHISQEAVTRIQREEGACPLCKEHRWSSVLDKYFQRKVNSVHVFCHHDDKGCGWQGEVVDFQHHVESCSMSEGPQKTNLKGYSHEKGGSSTSAVSPDESYEVVMLPHYSTVRPTGKILGRGAYGDVLEVSYNGRIYAAKKYRYIEYHRSQLMNKEIGILCGIRHSNIVPYYGVSRLPDRSQVLVMEKLEMNLVSYLAKEKGIMPIQIKCKLLLDIAEGLNYLHSHAIIHCDLTASNVLISNNGVAKIADFGNSKFVSVDETPMSPMTSPATLDYMPPEVLEGGEYSEKLDIFFFGHLSICTFIQQRPHRLKRPTYRRQGRLFARTEVERREDFLERVKTMLKGGDQHPLYSLIIQCLQDEDHLRPSSKDIISLLYQTID